MTCPTEWRQAMRLTVLAGLLLVGCSSVGRPALVAGPPHEVALPAVRVKDFFVLSCTIDERGPFDLILDTGSAWLVLDPRVAHEVGEDHELFTAGTVRAGPVAVSGLRAQTRPLSALSNALGRPIDGILGYPFFGEMLLTIDYARGRVLASGVLLDPGAPDVVPTDALEERPFVEATLQGTAYRVLIDTGSGVTLALPAGGGIEWIQEPQEIGRSMTIQGTRVRRAGKAGGVLALGGLRLPRPLVEIGVAEPRVGAGLLRGTLVSFDQRSRLVRLIAP